MVIYDENSAAGIISIASAPKDLAGM